MSQIVRGAAIPVLSLSSLLLLAAAAPAPDVRFTEVARTVGIGFEQANSATSNKYLLETMGGGVALFDYDNDGRLDVFFTNGAKLEDPMPPGKAPAKSDRKHWNRLYKQSADGTFADVTEKAGLTGLPQDRYDMGAAVGDYDNDGFPDLYVTSYGANTLYRNNGDGTFRDVTAKAGVAGSGWSASAGFFDYDNDGRLDLFVTRYVVWSFEKNGYCGEKRPGYRAYCHPDNYEPSTSLLFRNNGDGTFSDASAKAGLAASHGKALGVAFADYDHDGHVDVYVANDSVQSQLFHNNGNGTFTEEGLLLGVGFNEDGKTFAGMGVDFADYDNDGRPDVVVTDLSNERYRLFRQGGDGSFQDATNASGVGAATLAFAGWSTGFIDYDNDGWKDLFVAQGHVMDTIEKTAPNLRYLQPLLLAPQRGRALLARPARGGLPGRVGGARRRLRRPRRGRRRGRRGQQRGSARARAAQRRREPRPLAPHPHDRYTLQSRRHRLPRQGDYRGREPVVHGHHGRRVSLRERQAAAGRAGLGEHGQPGRGPLALGRRADAPRRGRRPDARAPGARTMITRRSLLALLAGSVPSAFGQGVSSRGVRPQPRGKPSGLPFHSRLTDVAAKAGLTQPIVYGGLESKSYIIEVVGCGVAFFDYDNDGWLDLLVLNGTRLEGAPPGVSNRLYKNNRDGTFTDVTEKAGLTRAGWASAVTVADYDNDGHDDLFITYYGQNVLYRNNGNGTFTDVTARAGLLHDSVRYASGCTWLDYDRDGKLDLFVAYYLDTTLEKLPKPGENPDCRWKGVPVNCGPRGLPPGFVRLYHNNGDGTFSDVSEAAGVSKAGGSYPMTAVAADFDNDGWPDVYVACDSTPSWLFRNQKDGTFRQEALERGVALSEDGLEQAGMGVAVADYDLDGHLDIFKTHFSDDTHVLYRNDGKGYFDDVTIRSGLGVETRYVGWGAGIVDLDNDGHPDLFLVTGSVYPEVEKQLPAYPFRTPRLVFRNLGNGRFEELIEEAGSGVAATHPSRGCAFGDFDNDGDVDVLVMNMNEPPSLLRNDVTGGGHWLKVLLVGVKSNRSAIGARVVARYGERAQAQEVQAQSSFYSANDRRLHFGLGASSSVDLAIRWPSGATEEMRGVAADQLVVVREGGGIVSRQKFGK